ncbi:MAG: 6,7-dimethyl-8-ribityllumazine synthase [Verrucomicrobiota bacterium]|nr:6,7-dimethyl-8-ribityllumazine synthase [Verrucomicrobiota bacterium]
MLKKASKAKTNQVSGTRVTIVASRYNARYVNSMLRAAKTELAKAKVAVEVVRVPGAFEIPAVASALAGRLANPVDAILCLGVILRGETTHAENIGQAVTGALAQLQVEHSLPVIHEVLLLENVQQAKERCLDARNNRGIEAARTAVEMMRVMRRVGV